MNSFSPVTRVPLFVGAIMLVCWGHLHTTFAAPAVNGKPQVSGESGVDSKKPTNPSPPLDVVLERIDIEGKSLETVGEGIVGDDAHQTIIWHMMPTQTQNFLAHIKNNGQNTASFRVNLSGPLSAQKTETAWKAKGWSCLATIDGDTTNVLALLQSTHGWTTPRLAPGAETVLRLSVTTKSASEPLDFAAPFRLTAQSGDLSDAVVAQLGVQFIARVEWSMDGYHWQPVNGTAQIPVLQGIGLRAVRANPKIAWDDFAEFLPTWDYQESWHTDTSHGLGEMIWLEFKGGGTINFTANGGNMVSGKIVLPPDIGMTNDDD